MKINLLAISALALAMPIAANAARPANTTPVYSDTASVNGVKAINAYTLSGGTQYNGTIAGAVGSLSNVSISITNALHGNATYNTFFTLASNSNLNGNWNGTPGAATNSVTLYDVSDNSVVSGTYTDGHYAYAGLKAGDTYDWATTGVVTAATGSYISSFTVAAVPEPEEWAMLLAGLGLIGFKLARSRRESSMLNVGTFA
jgi:hypothetical protein